MSNPYGILGGLTGSLYGGPNQNNGAPGVDATGANAALGVGGGQQIGSIGGQAAYAPLDYSAEAAQAQSERDAQNSAIKFAQGQANGTGPSAAAAEANSLANKGNANANALASSSLGPDQALARRNAIMAGSQNIQSLGGAATDARVKEQIAGGEMLGKTAGQARGQSLQGSAQQAQTALGQAQIAEQQNAVNVGAAESNQAANNQTMQQLAGMAEVAGIALLAADAPTASGIELVEPNKDPKTASRWAIREMPGFLMAIDRNNNMLMKFKMEPLSAEEEKLARSGQHGAGPLPVNGQPVNTGPGNMDPMGGQAYSDDNEPRTQRAAPAAGAAVGRAATPDPRQLHAGLYYAHDLGTPDSGDQGMNDIETIMADSKSKSSGNSGGMLGGLTAGLMSAGDMDLSGAGRKGGNAYMADFDPSMSGASSAGAAAGTTLEDQNPPSQGVSDSGVDHMSDEDFGRLLAQSTYGGADSSGNQYAVPGYQSQKPYYRGPDPEDDQGSDSDWRKADQLAQSTSEGLDRPDVPKQGGFGKYSQPAKGVGGGDANPTEDSSSGGSRVGKALVGALAGYANPQGAQQAVMNRLLSNQPGAAQAPTAVAPAQSAPMPRKDPLQDVLSMQQQNAMQPKVYSDAPGQAMMGSVDVTNNDTGESALSKDRSVQTDDKTYNGMWKKSASEIYTPVDKDHTMDKTDFAAQSIYDPYAPSDPYASLPQGLPTVRPFADQFSAQLQSRDARKENFMANFHPNHSIPKGAVEVPPAQPPQAQPDVIYGPDKNRWVRNGDAYAPAGPAPREPTSVVRTYPGQPPANQNITEDSSGLRKALGAVRVRPGNPPSSEPITKQDEHQAEVERWKKEGVEEVDKPAPAPVAKAKGNKPASALQKRFNAPIRRRRAGGSATLGPRG